MKHVHDTINVQGPSFLFTLIIAFIAIFD